jgi:signal transduction histidine kinase
MSTDGAKKILIIDSDRLFAENAASLLRREKFEVVTAENGLEALREISIQNPPVILLDLRLKDGNGYEILRWLQGNPSKPTTIIITGCDDTTEKAHLLEKPYIDFLSKPIEQEILLMTIRNVWRGHESNGRKADLDQYSSLERFFPFLAHELRNPLHAIGGALTIIQKRIDLKDEVLSRSVRIIQEEIKHLNDFVQSCLDFVQPPAGSRVTDVNVNEICRVVTDLIPYMFEDSSKRVKIACDLDPSIPRVQARYEELKRAFLNILKNGFEAVEDGGEIRIKTRTKRTSSPEGVEILFSDSGSGIKKENLKSLFIPFFSTKLRGTGLGLAIARQIIVDGHHGKIEIQSEEGTGTIVIIELPVENGMRVPGGVSA